MPRELLCTKPECLEWADYSDVGLAPNEVRIRPRYSAAKHGTEMSYFKGYGNPRGRWDSDLRIHRKHEGDLFSYPKAVGNMFVGPVVEIGTEVSRFKVGDWASGHGGFRNSHVMQEDAGLRFEGEPDEALCKAALCEDPAHYAFSALRDGPVRFGDGVAVFGLGAISLIIIQFLRRAGAGMILAIDPIERRREIAGKLGADCLIDPIEEDAGFKIKEYTGGRGVDVCIEYSGSANALQDALRGVAFGGTVVYGAFPGPFKAGLDFGGESHMNIPKIVFSRAESDPNQKHPSWNFDRIRSECKRMILQGQLDGQLLIDPVVAFEDLEDAYPEFAADPTGSVKLGVKH